MLNDPGAKSSMLDDLGAKSPLLNDPGAPRAESSMLAFSGMNLRGKVSGGVGVVVMMRVGVGITIHPH